MWSVYTHTYTHNFAFDPNRGEIQYIWIEFWGLYRIYIFSILLHCCTVDVVVPKNDVDVGLAHWAHRDSCILHCTLILCLVAIDLCATTQFSHACHFLTSQQSISNLYIIIREYYMHEFFFDFFPLLMFAMVIIRINFIFFVFTSIWIIVLFFYS